MKKILVAVLGMAIAGLLVAVGWGYWILQQQGVPADYWATYKTAAVTLDENGIPTIEAPSWERVIEAQGFALAADRMWQMDLIRRKVRGRLSEWFGGAAFDHDSTVVREDRAGVADKAADLLPASEKSMCESYARGINQFITDFPGRWGIEYKILQAEPEPWTCGDTMAVILEMSDVLTTSADNEAGHFVWRRSLPPGWERFLYTYDHPWNVPLFGDRDHGGPKFPGEDEFLPVKPISGVQEASTVFADPEPVGSNNWAWAGKTGAFLANDTHLGYGVPGIWFLARLKVSPTDWVVGTTIPGIPGIIIGMNPALSWAFTNTGEDVDDYLEEKLSDDGAYYLARRDGGDEYWQPVRTQVFQVRVKDEQEPRKVEARFTHRGPLTQLPELGGGWYSRQWLGHRPDRLRLPSVAMSSARTLDQLEQAFGGMTIPAQNVVAMDHGGNIQYRTSGTGVIRRVTGNKPQPAVEGEWSGYQPTADRPRLRIARDPQKAVWLATANERIWRDEFGHTWFSDDRKNRIETVLRSREDLTQKDMEDLHHDTTGRFRKLLVDWVVKHSGPLMPEDLRQRYQVWDGSSRSDIMVFTHSGVMEDALVAALIARVREEFIPEADRKVQYRWSLRRAWLTAMLQAEGDSGLRPFGLTSGEVARFLVDVVVKQGQDHEPHPKANRLKGQHPFVGKVPLLGDLFRIRSYHQWGAFDLVCAEKPSFGPSMRLIFNMDKPWDSTWILPVGQSGHVRTPFYKNMQESWYGRKTFRVFGDRKGWEFIARG